VNAVTDRVYVSNFDSDSVGVIASPTLQQATQFIISRVKGLVDKGVLKQEQGDALTAPLQAAIPPLDQGDAKTAITQLQAFINQLNGLTKASVLSPAQGPPLVNQALAVIRQLGG